MICKKAMKRLSEYFDGVLDSETAVEIERHVKNCAHCRDALIRLTALHEKLRSIEKVPVPDYLHHLIELRLKKEERVKWYASLKDAVSFRWSRIRTTGIQFYWTKALGTVMTAIFLWAISVGINPFYPAAVPSISLDSWTSEQSERVQLALIIKLGGVPIEQHLTKNRHYAAINDLYFNHFWDSIPEISDEEFFSVVTTIDSGGTVTLENVLDYPEDKTLITSLNDMIRSARGRPASMNGKSISSPTVLNLSWITVSPDS